MLQYPINVKPENYAFDATTDYNISFTFNGDALWGVIVRVYDYDTSKKVYEDVYIPNYNKPLSYNGDTVTRRIPANSLNNGKDYILQMMFMQRKEDSSLVYDMPVVGGSIYEHSGQQNIYVASNMTSIYSWGHDGSGYYYPTKINGEVFAGAIIKIGNESRFIERYSANGTRGSIWVSEAFGTEFKGGEKYQIYSNYIITPQYFFSCRSIPDVGLTLSAKDSIISCDGTYSQSENSSIKYYTMKLHWANNPLFFNFDDLDGHRRESYIVDETEKIFSQDLSYDFIFSYRHSQSDPELINDYYKVVAEIVTQDNLTFSVTSNVLELEPNYNYENPEYSIFNYLKLTWDNVSGRVKYILSGYFSRGDQAANTLELFRTNLDTEEMVRVPTNFWDIERDEEGNIVLVGEDMTASTHGRYHYDFYWFCSTGGIDMPIEGVLPYGEIEINDYSYYISDLTEYTYSTSSTQLHSNDSSRFLIGDTWKFVADIQDSVITNNLDRQSYVGYSQFITSISTNVNYMSGTLTGALGQLNCATKTYTDDIALVRAWRKFITQKKPFLLKSQKGDVWIVNVIENPTTTYQENTRGVPTTFSFTWAEVYDADKVVITSWGRGD